MPKVYGVAGGKVTSRHNQLIVEKSANGLIDFAEFALLLIVLTVPCVFFYKKDELPAELDEINSEKVCL